LPFKIKDAQFVPGYTRRFVTGGIQHLNFWKFNGQTMEYKIGEMTIPKVFAKRNVVIHSHNRDNTGKFGLNLVV
jgi:hypothetical protein